MSGRAMLWFTIAAVMAGAAVFYPTLRTLGWLVCVACVWLIGVAVG